MNDTLEIRRRRLAWRAWHRGTRELDLMLGRYADATLASMGEAELHRFEEFLAVADPELHSWILKPDMDTGGEFAELVGALRRFHGLG